MNTNSNLTGFGVVDNVTAPVKKDWSTFVIKHETNIFIGIMCFLAFFATACFSYKINQLETIAQGIYIDANYDRILMGQLNTRDYKIMQSINLDTDNITQQRKDFIERFR
ncbi:MAG: hypothetical protein ACKOXV_06900 [Bacteroidota bacterium]